MFGIELSRGGTWERENEGEWFWRLFYYVINKLVCVCVFFFFSYLFLVRFLLLVGNKLPKPTDLLCLFVLC